MSLAMNQCTHAASERALVGDKRHASKWETAGVVYARVALGAAFLSAVAGRFGLWQGTFNLEYFAKFRQYAAEVNSFMPSAVIPVIAWTATVAETTLGVLLILGLWLRWVSLGSAILLALFGAAMAISFGLKSPMDYSVFSASGAAVLLAVRLQPERQHVVDN
jgi:putative oxidoreductase